MGRKKSLEPVKCVYCRTTDEVDPRNRSCRKCSAVASLLYESRKKTPEKLKEEIERALEVIAVKRKILRGVHPLTGKPLDYPRGDAKELIEIEIACGNTIMNLFSEAGTVTLCLHSRGQHHEVALGPKGIVKLAKIASLGLGETAHIYSAERETSNQAYGRADIRIEGFLDGPTLEWQGEQGESMVVPLSPADAERLVEFLIKTGCVDLNPTPPERQGDDL